MHHGALLDPELVEEMYRQSRGDDESAHDDQDLLPQQPQKRTSSAQRRGSPMHMELAGFAVLNPSTLAQSDLSEDAKMALLTVRQWQESQMSKEQRAYLRMVEQRSGQPGHTHASTRKHVQTSDDWSDMLTSGAFDHNLAYDAQATLRVSERASESGTQTATSFPDAVDAAYADLEGSARTRTAPVPRSRRRTHVQPQYNDPPRKRAADEQRERKTTAHRSTTPQPPAASLDQDSPTDRRRSKSLSWTSADLRADELPSSMRSPNAWGSASEPRLHLEDTEDDDDAPSALLTALALDEGTSWATVAAQEAIDDIINGLSVKPSSQWDPRDSLPSHNLPSLGRSFVAPSEAHRAAHPFKPPRSHSSHDDDRPTQRPANRQPQPGFVKLDHQGDGDAHIAPEERSVFGYTPIIDPTHLVYCKHCGGTVRRNFFALHLSRCNRDAFAEDEFEALFEESKETFVPHRVRRPLEDLFLSGFKRKSDSATRSHAQQENKRRKSSSPASYHHGTSPGNAAALASSSSSSKDASRYVKRYPGYFEQDDDDDDDDDDEEEDQGQHRARLTVPTLSLAALLRNTRAAAESPEKPAEPEEPAVLKTSSPPSSAPLYYSMSDTTSPVGAWLDSLEQPIAVGETLARGGPARSNSHKGRYHVTPTDEHEAVVSSSMSSMSTTSSSSSATLGGFDHPYAYSHRDSHAAWTRTADVYSPVVRPIAVKKTKRQAPLPGVLEPL